MPTYLVHGFRWPRPLIRIHIILNNLDDAAAEWLMAPTTTRALTDNLNQESPAIMRDLSSIHFIEQYDPEDESAAAKSQPYAYVCDVVHEVKLGIDIDDVRGKGVSNEAWGAMVDLRDKLAPGEKVAWFVVVCGDVDRYFPPTVQLLDGSAAYYKNGRSADVVTEASVPASNETGPKKHKSKLSKLFGLGDDKPLRKAKSTKNFKSHTSNSTSPTTPSSANIPSVSSPYQQSTHLRTGSPNGQRSSHATPRNLQINPASRPLIPPTSTAILPAQPSPPLREGHTRHPASNHTATTAQHREPLVLAANDARAPDTPPVSPPITAHPQARDRQSGSIKDNRDSNSNSYSSSRTRPSSEAPTMTTVSAGKIASRAATDSRQSNYSHQASGSQSSQLTQNFPQAHHDSKLRPLVMMPRRNSPPSSTFNRNSHSHNRSSISAVPTVSALNGRNSLQAKRLSNNTIEVATPAGTPRQLLGESRGPANLPTRIATRDRGRVASPS